MKIYSRVLVMMMLLTAVLLVACGGKEEPTPVPPTEVPPTAVPTEVPPTEVPTEVPPTEVPPTATAEPAPAMDVTTHESAVGGYTVDYPEAWFVSDLFGMGMFTSMEMDPDAMGDMSTMEGAIVVIMGGAQEDMDGDDPMDMLDQATGDFNVDGEDMEIVSGPTAVTINGADAAQMSVRGESDGVSIYASITVLTNGINSVIAMAITPIEEEETYASMFDAMFNSIIVSEDELADPFGDIEMPEIDAVNAGSLVLGEAVAGLILEDAAMSWTFDGTAGTAYNLVVTPIDDNLDVIVDVIDATGASILPFGEMDDAFGEESVAFDIPADGTYTVVLHGFATSNGAYTLLLTGAGESTGDVGDAGNVIGSGETFTGVVPEGESITWQFSGNANDVISLVITPTDDNLDAVVDVIDADGYSLIGGEVDEEFDVETISDIVLPADGTYSVVIRGFAGGGGSYELLFVGAGSGAVIPAGGGGGSVSYGELVSGEVTSSDGNVWTFNGSEGDFVDVTVEPYDDFDVVLDVVDSAGNSMLFDGAVDNSFDTEFVRVVPIPADGQYAVVVTGYADGEIGTYDLFLGETLSGEAGSILFVYDEFTDPDEEGYTYPFTAAEGEYVTLYVNPETDLDVVLGVYNEETDELIEEVDNYTGREELIFYAEELDNYYFLVTSYDGGIGGFDLTLSGSAYMIPEIFVSDAIIGRVVDGEILSYGYYAEAGTTVSFVIESDENMDMLINLEDLDGNILVDMDDGMSGEGELLTYTFEESLYIFVNVSEFYGDAGNFALYIE